MDHDPGSQARAGRAGQDRLSIALTVDQGRVAHVALDSTRRLDAVRALVGQPIGVAVGLIGRVFTLCAKAQTVAAVQAAEAATGQAVSGATAAARRAQVLCEAVEQSVLRMALDWPAVAGTAPDIAAVRHLRRGLEAVRGAAAVPGWNQISGVAEGSVWPPPDLAEALEPVTLGIRAVVFGDAPVPETRASLARLADSPGAAVAGALALALDVTPDGAPGEPVAPLRGWTLAEIARRLSGPGAAAFAARPDWHGAPAETGALAHFIGHPLVRGLLDDGAGLAARLAARLLDLDRMLAELADLAQGPGAADPTVFADGPGCGLSAVETARGLLVHRVVVAGGRVADWRIVAPTEWTFHPDGALARAPLGWPTGDRAVLTRRVQLLVAAMDPCVGHDVTIRETAPEVAHA
ncbi:hypothetical protein [uncultured Rhodospira sp.]|uniref:hypothetical protein n=1 Tax=uncultured Rhodospira sp. TaxID=1936189 RepID=UPI00261BBD16|nr:hypothetical protein [uncultured Rhodospira sp.]